MREKIGFGKNSRIEVIAETKIPGKRKRDRGRVHEAQLLEERANELKYGYGRIA